MTKSPLEGTGPRLAEGLEKRRQAVDRALDRALPGDAAWPATIHRAARYSLLAGGKRIRPVLALATARAIGRDVERLRTSGLVGTPSQIVDRIGAYAAAGAETVYLQVLDLADHALIITQGRVSADGAPAVIREELRAHYLGVA